MQARLQRGLQLFFAQHGIPLVLHARDTNAVYDPETATVVEDAATDIEVRGQLYRKRKRRQTAGAGEQSFVTEDVQMAVLEARSLDVAPRVGWYLLEQENRWTIAAVKPQQHNGLVLTYELELAQG